MRLPAMAAWLGATLLLAGACTTLSDLGAGDASNDLAWDVSGGHSLDDVEWPNDLTAFHLGGGVDVDLTLPAGRHFDDHVASVVGYRHGRVIRHLNLRYPATTTDEAYDLARSLGGEWSIDLQNIHDWHERRRTQRAQGREDHSDVAHTGTPHGEPLGPDGPIPGIEIFNSFSSERPAVVALVFVWPRSTGP
jgi:hypothetical protein